jgi:hypothetical protein
MILLALLIAAGDPSPGPALQAALKGVKQDGKVQLPAEAQAELVALLPPARRGEECPDAAVVATEGDGIKDRGDGAVIVAEVITCKGGRVFALSTGAPPRVARLLDMSGVESVRGVKALNLGGGKRETDLGLSLLTNSTTAELRLFTRSDTGFSFTDAGTLREFDALRECADANGEGKGWSSFVRTEKEKLAVLRIDATCDGGVWSASCMLYRFDQGAVARSSVCPLPGKLDPKSLKLAGWK